MNTSLVNLVLTPTPTQEGWPTLKYLSRTSPSRVCMFWTRSVRTLISAQLWQTSQIVVHGAQTANSGSFSWNVGQVTPKLFIFINLKKNTVQIIQDIILFNFENRGTACQSITWLTYIQTCQYKTSGNFNNTSTAARSNDSKSIKLFFGYFDLTNTSFVW